MCLPVDWKEAQVNPLLKKGEKDASGNYSSVSLTSVVGIVLESIVREREGDGTLDGK